MEMEEASWRGCVRESCESQAGESVHQHPRDSGGGASHLPGTQPVKGAGSHQGESSRLDERMGRRKWICRA